MAPKRRRGKITAPLSKESTNSTDNYGINNNNKDDQEENQGIVERKSGNEYNNDPIPIEDLILPATKPPASVIPR